MEKICGFTVWTHACHTVWVSNPYRTVNWFVRSHSVHLYCPSSVEKSFRIERVPKGKEKLAAIVIAVNERKEQL